MRILLHIRRAQRLSRRIKGLVNPPSVTQPDVDLENGIQNQHFPDVVCEAIAPPPNYQDEDESNVSVNIEIPSEKNGESLLDALVGLVNTLELVICLQSYLILILSLFVILAIFYH
jgi:hypothetical protein